jgi:hypothetical protein
LREGRQWKDPRRGHDSRPSLLSTVVELFSSSGPDQNVWKPLFFTGWIYDHLLSHAAALKVAHPLAAFISHVEEWSQREAA